MIRTTIILLAASLSSALSAPHLDEEALGKSLGGWQGKTASYSLSGSDYRTYKPEVSPTPDGGLFVSIRIDHLRGVLSSNDHAVLEITISPNGQIASAQSSLALQGLSISSDLIRGSASAGAQVGGIGAAVKIGGDLVADLSSKLLREKIVEAGRVSFPAVLRHNYNQLYQAIRTEDGKPVAPAAAPTPGAPVAPAKEPEKPASPAAVKSAPLEPQKPAESSTLEQRAFGK
jgi:hypothetical protein